MSNKFKPGQLVVAKRLWNDQSNDPIGVVSGNNLCLYIRHIDALGLRTEEAFLLFGDVLVVAYPPEVVAFDPNIHCVL